MNFSALLSLPGSTLLLYGGSGLLFIIIGLIIYRRSFARKPLKETALASLRAEAEHWHVPEAVLPDFVAVMPRFIIRMTIGAGLGSLLFVVIYAYLLVSPLWSSLCLFNLGQIDSATWFLTCLLGGSIGGYSALLHTRREAHVTRSDGPRRRLSDYRSPFFYLVSGGWFVLFCVLLFAFHLPYLSPNVTCLRQGFYTVPWRDSFAYVWSGCAFIVLASTEGLLLWIAAATSPLIPTSVPDAGAVDDMFRAKIVSVVQFLIFVPIMALSGSLAGAVLHPYDYINILFSPFFFVAGMFLLTSSGALGGRLTGWFWQRKRTNKEQESARQ